MGTGEAARLLVRRPLALDGDGEKEQNRLLSEKGTREDDEGEVIMEDEVEAADWGREPRGDRSSSVRADAASRLWGGRLPVLFRYDKWALALVQEVRRGEVKSGEKKLPEGADRNSVGLCGGARTSYSRSPARSGRKRGATFLEDEAAEASEVSACRSCELGWGLWYILVADRRARRGLPPAGVAEAAEGLPPPPPASARSRTGVSGGCCMKPGRVPGMCRGHEEMIFRRFCAGGDTMSGRWLTSGRSPG